MHLSQVSFSGGCMTVTGAWAVKENWSAKKAVLCSPKDVKPRLRFPCRSFFDGDKKFEEVFNGLGNYRDEAAEGEDDDEAGEQAPPSTPKKPSLPVGPGLKKVLSKKAQQALASMKKGEC